MSSQAQETASPASSRTVQSLLDQRLPQILQDAGQIGNAGVVLQDGDIIAQSHHGLRQKDRNTPIGPNDKWHIGSITKSITATLIGRLVDKGQLSFDSTIGELWLDAAAEMDPIWRTVTLGQLLHHTSGAKANFGLKVLFDRSFTDQAALDAARAAAVRKILQKPPAHQPGTKFEYSNIGYAIAGQLASVVAGESWEYLVQQEVFEPLGLDSAGFGAPKGDNPWGHGKKWLVMITPMDPQTPESDNSPIMGPAGTVHMSLQDLAKYGQAHLATARGESDYLSASTIKWLHQAPKPINADHPPYAGGWIWMSFSDDERLSLFHNGSNTMWYAFLVNDPKTNASFALATNIGHIKRSEFGFGQLTRDLLRLLDQQAE
ncbi:serine hydrolase domain-containing protein [Maritalea mediterranea]|uniref:Beta-lactamase family protein n=1 Tax=Maritalea mediterranea TaxID=2909667 RepID=A0ABS9E9G0_9HYPH|nr:serine hydrolase domain-containing protein [Maritalea mediterranea]MCF4099433.1 beta-lactamase family protein [Maritalea mediterranea]